MKSIAGPVGRLHRRFGTLALALTALSFGVLRAEPAAAQYSRDRAAEREIAKAISRHYLAMRFDAAEKQLLGVVKSCKRKCRPETVAKAWMYVGIVRGSGKEDLDAAGQAFDTALSIDPRVALDDALATGGTQAAYQAALDARGGNTQALVPPVAAPTATTGAAPTPAEGPRPSTGLSCLPSARDVQTRRPIPVECRGDEEEVRFSLRYKLPGESSWKTLEMQRRGATFRAQIPCQTTMTAGNVDFYVIASDASGAAVETFGSKSAPEHFVVDPTSETAPAFDGEPPPARCEEPVLCPPDFPGCEDTMGDENDAEADQAASYARNRIGVHFAADFGFIQGTNVCATSNENFECFTSGADTPYPGELPSPVSSEPGELGDPYPGTGIRSGASGGTLRALFSYDRAFSQRISAGVRLGYAFGGAPKSLDGRSFLPLHAEGRLQYWLRGLGAKGLKPYLNVGGGVAQVDLGKTGVTVRDCSEEPARQAFLDCIDARNAYDSSNDPVLPTRTLDSYRKLGNGFASAGAGVLMPLGAKVDVQFNLNAMLMIPSVGLVLQPSIGLGYSL